MVRLRTHITTWWMILILGCASWGVGPVRAAGTWEVWENCTLVDNPANDGDSFHVRKKGGRYTYILRLYYVDSPETDTRIPERVKEQAEYWGLSEADALRLGKEAAVFTRQFLSSPFTVYTRKEDARGASDKNRYYAMIRSGDTYLADALVREGLARIHGKHPDDPPAEVPSPTRFTLRIKGSENDARKHQKGGWGIAKAPPAASVPPVAPFEPRTVMLDHPLSVYSLHPPFQRVGLLKPGARVDLLRIEEHDMIRIRFSAGESNTYEAQCRRGDL